MVANEGKRYNDAGLMQPNERGVMDNGTCGLQQLNPPPALGAANGSLPIQFAACEHGLVASLHSVPTRTCCFLSEVRSGINPNVDALSPISNSLMAPLQSGTHCLRSDLAAQEDEVGSAEEGWRHLRPSPLVQQLVAAT